MSFFSIDPRKFQSAQKRGWSFLAEMPQTWDSLTRPEQELIVGPGAAILLFLLCFYVVGVRIMRTSFFSLGVLSLFFYLQACSAGEPGDGTTTTGSGGDSAPTGGASGGTIGDSGGMGAVSSGGSTTGGPSGGGPASGGALGTATGGAAGGDGSGGSEVGGPGCSAADIFCETFESYDGVRPSGGMWLDDPCASNPNYMASGQAGAGPDGSVAFVTSGASTGTNYCVLMTDLGDQLTEFWLTATIKIGGTNPDMEHEVTFLELGPETQDTAELRIGYRGDNSCGVQGFELGALEGPGGEYTGCTGYKPVAEQWYCLETHVDQSGATGSESQLYVDGELQDYNVHGMIQPSVLSNSKARYLKVGMQSYGGEFGSLTIDDLSVSTTRVGCD